MTTHHWTCALIGGEVLLRECGTRLQAAGHRVVAAVARQPGARRWAADQGIPVLDRPRALLDFEFDLLFSIANLEVLPPEVLQRARRAAVNFHDGPLPERAGVNAPVWAILEGATDHAVTWHRMEDRPDTGAILQRADFAISPSETALTLNAKCFEHGLQSFDRLLADLAANRLDGVPQSSPFGRYHTRADALPLAGFIDPGSDADAIGRLVRALDMGAYPNPVGLPKLVTAEGAIGVRSVALATDVPPTAPGTVLAVEEDELVVGTGTVPVRLGRLVTLEGEKLSARAAASRLGLGAGDVIPSPHPDLVSALQEWRPRLVRSETLWVERLQSLAPLTLPWHEASTGRVETLSTELPTATAAEALALALAVLGRVADQLTFDVAHDNPIPSPEATRGLIRTTVPFRATLDLEASFRALVSAVTEECDRVDRGGGWYTDLHARMPGLAAGTLPALQVAIAREPVKPDPRRALTVVAPPEGGQVTWHYDPDRLGTDWMATLSARCRQAWASHQRGATLVGDLDLFRPGELIREQAPIAAPEALVDELISRAAAAEPARTAVRAHDGDLSFAQLVERADALAARLVEAGVRRGDRVGIALGRGSALPVSLLAVLRAGAAYVPLDPDYPAARLEFVARDAGLRLVLAAPDQLPTLDLGCPRLEPIGSTGTVPHFERATDDLAYVLYTSGSTGEPKGVMVEHRQVTGFFAAMDRELGPTAGTWLAVTSLSFDISVLELLWTLSRGFTVVLHPGVAGSAARPHAGRVAPSFSLFYFASAGEGSDYRLLLDGARFADAHGFEAVWVPERHFHAFGGLFPNPAVAAAAVAGVTSRIAIRAGSVVLPLHHPVRVAEEWAMVDRLSGGRAGMSVASGWMPRDFILNPGAFGHAKRLMVDQIDQVRRLWRGETLTFPGPDGADTEVRVLPRPVQAELPLWITSAGNADTFALAGRLGANILTHLLGQSVEELVPKLAAYRAAWQAAGHGGDGRVTLMLHTFVGPDEAEVRDLVRGPMREYLRSAVSLIRPSAWAFPAFRRPAGATDQGDPLAGLSEADLEALLDHAFERYYASSGLFGTPDQCVRMAERLAALGVDEIGCLIDFGVDTEATLAHLPWLDQVRARVMEAHGSSTSDPVETLATTMEREGVTHFQCTPSLAQVLAGSEAGRRALGRLEVMLVGGEALSSDLADRLRTAVRGRLLNVYGPTEATVWATVHEVAGGEAPVPIGRPLANTLACVVDSRGRAVPDGTPGELVLSGPGVARGYHNRAALSAERFGSDPLGRPWRAYRTGDRAVRRPDGVLEFLGRLDAQVKIRGHRIEPGEVEAVLRQADGVADVTVVVREDVPGDRRLVAYVVSQPGRRLAAAALRDLARVRLPEYMVPSQVMLLDAFPLTPNGKLDRRALPAPAAAATGDTPREDPEGDLEATIANDWAGLLGLEAVGRHENFFDLGGHSLLAIQAHRRLTQLLGREVSITDLFRFPTVAGLARHLTRGEDLQDLRRGAERGQRRLAALGRRTAARPGEGR